MATRTAKKRKKTSPEKRGRKKIPPVDWEFVASRVAELATGEEIAAELDISYSTLVRQCQDKFGMNFDEYKHRRGLMPVRMELRRLALELARHGDMGRPSPQMVKYLADRTGAFDDTQRIDNQGTSLIIMPGQSTVSDFNLTAPAEWSAAVGSAGDDTE